MSKFAVLLGGVVIDSSNNILRFEEGGTTRSVTIPSGTYFLSGSSSGAGLESVIETALNATAGIVNAYDITVTTNGVTASWNRDPASPSAIVVIQRASGLTAFRTRWNDALSTFPKALLGFSTEKLVADIGAELSTLTPSSVWVANDMHARRRRRAEWKSETMRMTNGSIDVVRIGDKARSQTIDFERINVKRAFVEDISADTARSFESFLDSWGNGSCVELHETSLQAGSSTLLGALNESTTRVGTSWILDAPVFDPEPRDALPLVDFSVDLREWVTP